MGRIRTIKPEFFRSRSLAKCPVEARLTFAGLWTEADDHGRGIADPRLIKGAVWPLDDDVTHLHVSAYLDTLAETGHIRLYQVSDETYFEVVNWEKHLAAAYRRGEAKYPPISAGQPLGGDVASSRMQENAGCDEMSAGTGNREQGTGNREGKGADKPRTPTRNIPITDDFEITDHLREWASREVPTVDIDLETKKFLDHHVGKGSSFKLPDRAWQKWMRQAAQWSAGAPNRRQPTLPPVSKDFSDWNPQNAA